VMAERENVCSHLHLPLQSGSDPILRAMRRKYTVAEYLALVDTAREMVDGLALTTDMIFGIIGCMAQRLGERLCSDVVRVVAGPDSYRHLPGMLRRAASETAVDTLLNGSETYEDIEPTRTDSRSAWVAVTRGCDNFCSYCIVPYTRGRERSIPLGRIISQIEELKRRGYCEITLLGQNVNSYRDGEVGFAGLLKRVSDTGIEWIRFLTSHPADLNRDILAVMAERENVCSHLHLPLQSGSDPILRAMRRKYTVADYLALVDTAREMVDGLALTTDMIFGFPGETEEDFQATLSVMETVRFDYAFLYRYSEREGTPAAKLGGSVPERVRIERLNAAIELQRRITRERHEEQVGKVEKVLVKSRSKDGNGWFGFSGKSMPVIVRCGDGGVSAGSFVEVRITGTTGASLLGECIPRVTGGRYAAGGLNRRRTESVK